MAEEWDKWNCPHPDCEDGREYDDPDTIFVTTCDKGHTVNLIWGRDGKVSARLPNQQNEHRWVPHLTGKNAWYCLGCGDTKKGFKAPKYGCVGHRIAASPSRDQSKKGKVYARSRA
jgi:hypothetical protein